MSLIRNNIVSFLKRDISEKQTEEIKTKINGLPYIESVVYRSKMELSKEMMDSSDVFSTVMKDWDEGTTPIQAPPFATPAITRRTIQTGHS